MTDETYEGWANRETWCANLWLANEEGLYRQVSEQAEWLVSTREDAVYVLEDELRDMFAEWETDILDGTAVEGVRQIVLDIGSLYRVDWREIATHWVADAMANAETGR